MPSMNSLQSVRKARREESLRGRVARLLRSPNSHRVPASDYDFASIQAPAATEAAGTGHCKACGGDIVEAGLISQLQTLDKPMHITCARPGPAPPDCRWFCCICKGIQQIFTKTGDLRLHLRRKHGISDDENHKVFGNPHRNELYQYFGPCSADQARRNGFVFTSWANDCRAASSVDGKAEEFEVDLGSPRLVKDAELSAASAQAFASPSSDPSRALGARSQSCVYPGIGKWFPNNLVAHGDQGIIGDVSDAFSATDILAMPHLTVLPYSGSIFEPDSNVPSAIPESLLEQVHQVQCIDPQLLNQNSGPDLHVMTTQHRCIEQPTNWNTSERARSMDEEIGMISSAFRETR